MPPKNALAAELDDDPVWNAILNAPIAKEPQAEWERDAVREAMEVGGPFLSTEDVLEDVRRAFGVDEDEWRKALALDDDD